jgi:hypothetical protein
MMSDKLVQTLPEVMGVIACGRQSDEFLDYRRVGECEIDSSLVEADGTDGVRNGGHNLALVSIWKQKLTS